MYHDSLREFSRTLNAVSAPKIGRERRPWTYLTESGQLRERDAPAKDMSDCRACLFMEKGA